MNSRYIAALSIVLVMAIGFLKTLTYYKGLKKRRDFVSEFTDKFVEFASKPDFDGALYYWLTHNSVAIQSELGLFGVMAYKPPAASYMRGVHKSHWKAEAISEIFRGGNPHMELASMAI